VRDGDLGPSRESFGANVAIVDCGEVEEIGNLIVNGQESLYRSLRFEPLRDPFSSLCRRGRMHAQLQTLKEEPARNVAMYDEAIKRNAALRRDATQTVAGHLDG